MSEMQIKHYKDEREIFQYKYRLENHVFVFRFNKSSRDNRTEAAESNSRDGPLQKAVNVRFLFAWLFCHSA